MIEGRGEIPPKEPNEVTDLKAMEEGVSAQTPIQEDIVKRTHERILPR